MPSRFAKVLFGLKGGLRLRLAEEPAIGIAEELSILLRPDSVLLLEGKPGNASGASSSSLLALSVDWVCALASWASP